MNLGHSFLSQKMRYKALLIQSALVNNIFIIEQTAKGIFSDKFVVMILIKVIIALILNIPMIMICCGKIKLNKMFWMVAFQGSIMTLNSTLQPITFSDDSWNTFLNSLNSFCFSIVCSILLSSDELERFKIAYFMMFLVPISTLNLIYLLVRRFDHELPQNENEAL